MSSPLATQNSLPVKIKLFDQSLPLPAYQSAGAAGFDFYSRLDLTIPPQTVAKIPLNVALEIPPDFWLQISARSSLHKKGLVLANGIGVGDPDYCGDGDEYRLLVFNFSHQNVAVKKGERLAQGILLPRYRAIFEFVPTLEKNANRGGLGSTGEMV